MTLYLASTNQGKLRELQGAALRFGALVEPLPAIDDLPACDEDGITFRENALKKALHYSAYSEGLVLADDSGICVDALDGAPGINSARFAGPKSGDHANNQKLLAALEGVPVDRRSAHYVCALAVSRRDQVLATAEGRVDGIILELPRGSGGFGYDPLFYYPPLDKAFGELTAEQKLLVSHRGRAFHSLIEKLGLK